jgi:RHS repeat-associated protein
MASLITSNTTNFYYGADQMRYKQVKSKSGVLTTTIYIGKLFEQITSGSTVTKKAYVDDIAVVSQTQGSTVETVSYIHRDRLGSMIGSLTASGDMIQTHSFDPFGKPRDGRLYDNVTSPNIPRNILGSVVTNRGFTDHEHLDDPQLIHMNGRVYDYNLGRFLSVDPFIQEPGNSQSMNPYSYIMNNPLAGTDPTGYLIRAGSGGSSAWSSSKYYGKPYTRVEKENAKPKENASAERPKVQEIPAEIGSPASTSKIPVKKAPSNTQNKSISGATEGGASGTSQSSFVPQALNDPTANGGEFDSLSSPDEVSKASEFADGFASFFEDISRVKKQFKALSGDLGEDAKKKALAADLILTTASAGFYFDATIEIDGKVVNIRNEAQKALTKSFNEHTTFFAGRASAQTSAGMFLTTVGKKALGLKLFSKQTGGLYVSLMVGNAGSLLTISSYGRGLNLIDKGVSNPIDLLSGSFIGRN